MAIRMSILALALCLLATVALSQKSAPKPGGPTPLIPPKQSPTPAPSHHSVAPAPHAPVPEPSGPSPSHSGAGGPAGESPADAPGSPNSAPIFSNTWITTAAATFAVAVTAAVSL
ncbi:hypothetical protein KSP40_PGU013736 [Platanthera guangdongensis]|uniref:Uncharacterized protein n=1 Tax=Platanthera guangdongensis TaxID=2320717 RepID=A0ABR2MZU5_9ASPA